MKRVYEGACTIDLISLPYQHGGVNVYLLENRDRLTLIDAGVGSAENLDVLAGALKQAGRSVFEIDRVLITHYHRDHIGLLPYLQSSRNLAVYAHPAAIPRIRFESDYMRMRLDFFRNLYHEMGCGELGESRIAQMEKSLEESRDMRFVGEIQPIMPDSFPDVAGLEPIFSPGHAPDHLMFYDRKEKVLISGDHVLPKISSNALVEPDVTGERLKSLVMYYRSLQQCRELDVDLALPGHGEPFRNFRQTLDQKIAHIEQKVNRVRALLADRPVTAFELARMYYPTEYKRQFSLVMSSIIGALDFLESEGRAVKFKRNGIWHYIAG